MWQVNEFYFFLFVVLVVSSWFQFLFPWRSWRPWRFNSSHFTFK
jgi:hypothetical protein